MARLVLFLEQKFDFFFRQPVYLWILIHVIYIYIYLYILTYELCIFIYKLTYEDFLSDCF